MAMKIKIIKHVIVRENEASSGSPEFWTGIKFVQDFSQAHMYATKRTSGKAWTKMSINGLLTDDCYIYNVTIKIKI